MRVYLITIGLIFGLMLAGIAVERLYRAFAAKHPQLGPFRKTDGCGCCAAKTDCASHAACDKP